MTLRPACVSRVTPMYECPDVCLNTHLLTPYFHAHFHSYGSCVLLCLCAHSQVNVHTLLEFSVHFLAPPHDDFSRCLSLGHQQPWDGREFRVEACCPFQEGARLGEVEPSFLSSFQRW